MGISILNVSLGILVLARYFMLKNNRCGYLLIFMIVSWLQVVAYVLLENYVAAIINLFFAVWDTVDFMLFIQGGDKHEDKESKTHASHDTTHKKGGN